jgi:selenocysteine lyase/cysteine desulfurase
LVKCNERAAFEHTLPDAKTTGTGGIVVNVLTPDSVRAEFPITASCTYLDSAYWGPYPKRTAAAISEYVERKSESAFPFGRVDAERVFVDSVRSKVADLLGATPEEVWFPRGTTDALGTVAAALLKPGDEILVGALDHPADFAVWANLAERGIQVRVVPQRDGRMNPEDIEDAIASNTRAIGMCLVTSQNGYRQDIEALSRLAGDHGLYLFLDAIQGIGHLAIDVRETNVTMISAGSYKWLCSPEGLGVAYVKRDVVSDIIPNNVHFYGMGPGDGGWSSFLEKVLEYGVSGQGPQTIPPGTLEYPDAAIRLEISPSIISLIGLNQMCGLLSEFGGIAAVEERVLSLAARLRVVVQEHGHRVLSPPEPAGMSGITCVVVPSALGFQEFAKERGVHVRARVTTPLGPEAVRVSTHFFNNENDIDQLVLALDEYDGR